MTAMLSAPAAFAEDGHHGDGNRGRGSDDAQVTTVRVDNDANEDVNENVNEDVNDDHGVDLNQAHIEHQLEDVVDDDD